MDRINVSHLLKARKKAYYALENIYAAAEKSNVVSFQEIPEAMTLR